MRTRHLLLAGLLASAVTGSAWAQATTPGLDPSSPTGATQSPPSGLDSGLKGGYSFQGGLATGGSALPPLSPPPPSSAIGNGPPGPPGPVRAGITAPQ